MTYYLYLLLLLLIPFVPTRVLAADGDDDDDEGGDDDDDEGGDDDADDNAKLKSALQSQRKISDKETRRANNLVKKFKDVDPDEYRRLQQEEQDRKDEALLKDGKVDDVVAERVAARQKEFDERESALKEENSGLKTTLQSLVVGNAMQAASIASGVNKKAVGSVVSMAERAGWLADGAKPVLYELDEEGEPKKIYGKDSEPITPEEWVESLRQDHDYLFEPSRGGGGQDGGGGKGGAPSTDLNKMSRAEKLAYIKEHGDAYQDLVANRPKPEPTAA